MSEPHLDGSRFIASFGVRYQDVDSDLRLRPTALLDATQEAALLRWDGVLTGSMQHQEVGRGSGSE
ncbi:MAG: hypothetical protein QGH20_00430 [Candidatus Latescibacteria bacterium]|jgi:hypothetical protein|nr:hypothetical protein [Candidatus Latescibacterota bacterium]